MAHHEKVKVNGISVSEYLRKDATKKEIVLTNKDFGKFAEIVGSRITWNFKKSGILNEVFPDISIISARRRYLKIGDIGYVVSYLDNGKQQPSDSALSAKATSVSWERHARSCEARQSQNGVSLQCNRERSDRYEQGAARHFKQKVVIFEVKHGKIWIGKYQFEKYCRILADPTLYFPKAEDVKIVFMMFEDIDTKNKSAKYYLKELDKELAYKFLDENNNGNSKNNKEEILIDCGIYI